MNCSCLAFLCVVLWLGLASFLRYIMANWDLLWNCDKWRTCFVIPRLLNTWNLDLIATSLLLLKNYDIKTHFEPNCSYKVRSLMSSSMLNSCVLMFGFKYFVHLSLHCLPFRFPILSAILVQSRLSDERTILRSLSSSSCVNLSFGCTRLISYII